MLKSKLFWIPLISLLVLIALGFGLLEFSSSPTFCRMCHVMEPYYQAWKTSSHKDVRCVECHIPPEPKAALWAKFQTINSVVQYVTKRYGTRPHAEIEDSACLRKGCHESRLLKGQVTFKRGIRFDHTPHLTEWRRGKRLRCTSCHSQIVVGNHMEVTTSTCFLCHFKGARKGRELHPLGGCPSCHPAPKRKVEVDGVRFSHEQFVKARQIPCEKCHRDVVIGDGEAPKDRCLNCHNKPERLSKYGDTKYMHEVHVTDHKVDCTHCHHEIKHRIIPLHIRRQARSCGTCHISTHLLTERLFRGEGGKGAPTIPSHMLMVRLDCASCHAFKKEIPGTPGGGQTMVASERVCADCHQEQWKGMIQDWKATLNKMINDVEAKLASASKRVQQVGPESSPPGLNALLERAAFNINFVKRARGVHNPFYAAELIVVANRSLDELFEKLGQVPPPLPEGSPVKGWYCALLCHRKAGVRIPREVKFQGILLPHKEHAFRIEMGCTTCHSPEKHKAISVTKDQCSQCHHKQSELPCGRCHAETKALYEGKGLPIKIATSDANPMAKMVDCSGCHADPVSSSEKNMRKACLNCHGEDYLPWLEAWKGESRKTLERVRSLASKLPARGEGLDQQTMRIFDFLQKAKGVHNPSLYEAIAEEFQKRAQSHTSR